MRIYLRFDTKILQPHADTSKPSSAMLARAGNMAPWNMYTCLATQSDVKLIAAHHADSMEHHTSIATRQLGVFKT